MSQWETRFPLGHQLFMKIAEPRVVRILHCLIYVGLLWAGIIMVDHPPQGFRTVLDFALLNMFSIFLIMGGLFGTVAALPGIWWLERVGLISLSTSMLIYIVTAIALNRSAIAIVFGLILILVFVLRWMEIRQFQLAPKEV